MTDLLAIGAIVFQLGIIGVLLEATRRRDVAAAVNALVSVSITMIPWAIGITSPAVVGRSIAIGPEIPLWLAVAGLLHSFGMLGPYDSIWWWDSLTHTISAALVAAIIYGGVLVTLDAPVRFDFPGFAAVLTVLFTAAAGIFWELIELFAREVGDRLDIEPVLVHYGLRDTAGDLVFDVVGALVVVILDVRVFVPVAETAPRMTRAFILASGGIIVVGSIALVLLIDLSRIDRS